MKTSRFINNANRSKALEEEDRGLKRRAADHAINLQILKDDLKNGR